MINAEKLLGKVIQEVMGSSSHGMKKKKKKRRQSSSIVSHLTSGAGLMTAIGLGIGAYEILKDKKQGTHTGGHYPSSPPGIPPANTHPGQVSSTTPPPPPPPPPSSTTVTEPTPPQLVQQVSPDVPAATPEQTEKLAIRLLQVMIAVAHADGQMDPEEEKAVIGKLKDEEFSQEEKMFLLAEMHSPKSIEDLTANITDPATAKMMYMLAVGTIEIDTPEERQWLDNFAAKLQLSKAVQDFIEDQV
jgi:uncharacterized membrane protein YebE (DUF533 family)